MRHPGLEEDLPPVPANADRPAQTVRRTSSRAQRVRVTAQPRRPSRQIRDSAECGTLDWKRTCRLSLQTLTALRMGLFGGAAVLVCVPVGRSIGVGMGM